MWVFAWTLNHGHNRLEDFWTIHDTEDEARRALDGVPSTRLHCWAIAPIKSGSEPHWEA